VVNNIPTVKVAPTEAGFLITCSSCPRFRTIRRFRGDADLTARDHQASHNTDGYDREGAA
jgi:hypothetical protein